MSGALPESLAPAELAALEDLMQGVTEAVSRAEILIPRLQAVEAAESLLSDRLRCVLEDSLQPAHRDLLSILQEARGEERA